LLCLIFATAGGMYEDPYMPIINETIGVVVEIEEDFLYIIGEPLTPESLEEVIVIIGDAPIYDLLTGFPADPSFIEKNMTARVAYDSEENAVAIWLNCDYDDSAVFSVMVSDNIQYGNDACIFLSTDSKYRVTITPSTIVLDPFHGVFCPTEIIPGQEFFIWVDMITASHPSLVYPDKVVLIYD